MRMIGSLAVLLSCVALGQFGTSAQAGEAVVKLEQQEHAVRVTIGDQEFSTYHTNPEQPKPYFSPVRAVDGAIVTRPLDGAKDHPHHKGIWVAVDEVNEVDFWAEKGKILNKSVELTKAEGNPAQMQVVNHWLGADDKPILIETTDIAIHANGLVTYDIRLKAVPEVTFRDTKEGLFGIRLADSLRESVGGVVINAEGLQATKDCWGKESKWVDYVGPVDGKTYGVAIFDHPGNARKSRYHVRNYGLFTISPFGQKAYTGTLPDNPLVLKAGEEFRLRYGLYIHAGDTAAGKVAEVYETFAK